MSDSLFFAPGFARPFERGHAMRSFSWSLIALAAGLSFALPAHAQSIGGGGIGGSSGASAGGGSSTPSLGGATNSLGSSGGVGSSSTSTQQRATAGSATINSVNADAAARSGNLGAASTIGNSTGSALGGGTFQSTAGTGPAALYNIPIPKVNVDLPSIRSALRQGPNATPDRYGN
ncbi:hypothetical protein NS365_16250 [Aureimonas ureilytica]|uniref:Uncharacterized protein n=2 Tax=Aurantimonadaceae TaxID=255475 RepID=A0A175R6W5_9HYPH|nr:hypothetical protein NS226_11825 [Aureimonas ureilytica]KTR04066.1 hypothetical protein NS365_16250 [Aureimonas ureilytica]